VAVVVWLVAAGTAAADDAALRCQRAVERGGRTYAAGTIRVIERCVDARGSSDLGRCLGRRAELRVLRRSWAARVARACRHVDVGSALGYLDTCVPPSTPSRCTFPSRRLDDRIGCLACQIDERLDDAALALFAARPIHDECQRSIGQGGLAVVRGMLAEIGSCLTDPAATSIAACLVDPGRKARIEAAVAAWRTAAEDRCRDVDPFARSGYPELCAGVEPTLPPGCGLTAPACVFPRTRMLTSPGADDDDLLDCLQCRVEEAALGASRDLYGADVCCTADGCATVRSRAACRIAGGVPMYYRVDEVPGAGGAGAHGLAVTDDGTLFFPDGTDITVLPPGGTPRRVASTDFVAGVAADQAGNAYAALRLDHRIMRFAPDGTPTVVAGTGTPGHSGDGGPATSAETVGPDGVAVDEAGNVYFTESSATISYLQGRDLPPAEHVRMVAPDGTIHTVAGNGQFGTVGIGGPAVAASIGIPYSIAIGRDRSLLVGDLGFERVLRIDAAGILRHVAGRPNVLGAYAGDGGPALAARLYSAEGVGEDAEGKVFIADMRNRRVRLVDGAGSIITIAGTAAPKLSYPGPALLASIDCPLALAVGREGRVYIPSAAGVLVLTPVRY